MAVSVAVDGFEASKHKFIVTQKKRSESTFFLNERDYKIA